jgi:hypothetical protein
VRAGAAAGDDRLGVQQRADPVQRRAQAGVRLPSTSARPWSGRSRPSSTRSEVDLPAPFGPRKPVTVPGRAVKLSPSTARLPS